MEYDFLIDTYDTERLKSRPARAGKSTKHGTASALRKPLPKAKQISAYSIARPLAEMLSNQLFFGYVLGRFKRVVNLIDSQQRIVALTTPDIGNGPFSIVIEANPTFFNEIDLNQPVFATSRFLKIGHWQINWGKARVWEPKLPQHARPFRLTPAIHEILNPYRDWPHLATNTPAARCTAQLARQATQELSRALLKGDRVAPAVKCLAGLGSGLTPAGDDYLVGVMAALWLLGQRNLTPAIAQIASPKTTALSAAFLSAAGQGEFIEPWHQLAQSLQAETGETGRENVAHIARFGASSGTDALAGFAATLIGIRYW